MSALWLVVVCRGALICLPPLGAYLFAVAGRHRRGRPVVVSGAADFLGLLAGLGGFLLVGGVVLLAAVQADARLIGRGTFADVQSAWGRDRVLWGAAALLYVGGLAAAVALALRGRAGSFAVYNADPDGVDRAVTDALAAAGVPAERFGGVWAADRPLASVDHLRAVNHSTVRVLARDPRLAEEIARQLLARLTDVEPARRSGGGEPFAVWATACLSGGLVAFGLLVTFEVLRRV